MATEIKMPQLSDTMHSGKIVAWSKKEGDYVERGEVLAEVETDKANLQIESFHKGTILKIVAVANSKANVGDVIAYIGEAGESIGVSGNGAQAAAPATPPPAPKPTPVAAAPRSEPTPIAPAPVAAQVTPAPVEIHQSSDGRIKASPLARKMAQEKNIDLTLVRGSGPEGRITKRDIEEVGAPLSAAVSAPAAHAAAPAYTPPTPSVTVSSGPTPGTLTPFSRMRETIARRMQESVTQSPHFYTTSSIRMDECLKFKELLKERPEYKGVTVNHLIIKAAAYALSKEPRVNRAVRDNQVWEPSQINVGIITAIEDGLLIPVIKEADKLPLKDLIFEARAAVERARAGRPNSNDLSGGTFSISNMGMFDIDSFTAIINPGQGAVLAVSSTKDTPVVVGGQIIIGKVMKVTLSVDHRVIDGVMSGNFLKHFKEALEVPAILVL